MIDFFLRVVCVMSLILTIGYKAPTGRVAYLFQPCHISNLLLTILCFWKGELAGKFFYFYVCFLYGTVLALVTPDLRGLSMFGELQTFFIQHAMLLILPAVWIATRRYHLYEGFRLSVLNWGIATLIHFDLLFGLSVALHGNINYMLVPPKVWPSRIDATYYRPIMVGVCLVFGLASRYILAQIPVLISGIKGQHAAELAREAEALKADSASGKGVSSGGAFVEDDRRPSNSGAGAMPEPPAPVSEGKKGALRHRSAGKQ